MRTLLFLFLLGMYVCMPRQVHANGCAELFEGKTSGSKYRVAVGKMDEPLRLAVEMLMSDSTSLGFLTKLEVIIGGKRVLTDLESLLDVLSGDEVGEARLRAFVFADRLRIVNTTKFPQKSLRDLRNLADTLTQVFYETIITDDSFLTFGSGGVIGKKTDYIFELRFNDDGKSKWVVIKSTLPREFILASRNKDVKEERLPEVSASICTKGECFENLATTEQLNLLKILVQDFVMNFAVFYRVTSDGAIQYEGSQELD